MAEEEEEVPVPAKKVFVLNAGGYMGKNLSKKFADLDADPKYEVIGTLAEGAAKPRWVKEVVEPTEAAMAAAFLASEITVLDLAGDAAGAETMLAALGGVGELESEKVLVGVSSVMTWTRTTVHEEAPEKPLTESEYKRRRPHTNFSGLLALEKMVTKSSQKQGLRTHVVAAGLTYGLEEDVFHPLFKAAWSCEPLPLVAVGDGSNLLPTIHVSDLCSIVVSLMSADSVPYLLAVDEGQTTVPEEEGGATQTLKAIVEAIGAELGIGASKVVPMTADEVLVVKDYEFFQTGLRLAGEAVSSMGFEWVSKEGLLKNIGAVVAEFRESRGLQPLRVLVHGNEEVSKKDLVGTICDDYKLPLITPSSVIEKAIGKLDEFEGMEELAAEVAAVPTPDAALVKALTVTLSTTSCKNQGYVLVGCPETQAMATALFVPPPPPEGEEGEAPPAEGEEGSADDKPTVPPPEFIVVLAADTETVKAKGLAAPNASEEEVMAKLSIYEANNQEDSPEALLSAPSLTGVESLGLEVAAATPMDALVKKTSIYLGEPRNYGPSDAELAAKAALAAEEKAKKEAEETRLKAQREADELEARKRREAQEARRLAELQQQERELLEVRSIPLRNYLLQNVIPTLTEGLIEVCKIKPEDPIDYLAEWLFKNNPVDEEALEQ